MVEYSAKKFGKDGIMKWMLLIAATLVSVLVQAEVKTEVVEYKEGKTALEGFIAVDDAGKASKPAILIVHQWMGLTDHEKSRAEELAKAGYLAFAVDIYGKGVKPQSPKEAGELAGKFKEDRTLYRARLKAAYDYIKKRAGQQKVVVMGYCFGGTGALELARSGVPVDGVVSFHGGLSNPSPKDAMKIKGKVLILHGAIDPYVPVAEVETFGAEMNQANVDYQFIAYSGAVHAFTQKEAGNDIKTGAAYNPAADRRSWQALMMFLKEVAPL